MQRMRILALTIVLSTLLAVAPQFSAQPQGIGSQGDPGCQCHGAANTATIVTLDGLPEQFNVSETYDLTLTVRNDGIPGGAEAPNMGGFRILVENGDLPVPVDDSLAQVLADGLTHTASGATMRSWDLQWTAPADATARVEFTIYGNAVNGNAVGAGNGNSGDQWNALEATTLGPMATSSIGAEVEIDPAPPLTILLTAVILALSLVLLGTMWVFYTRSPETFSLARFWSWLKPWLTTTDHKGVGMLYMVYGLLFFLVGGFLALLFRIQLSIPQETWFELLGRGTYFLTEDQYNSFFTLHGTTMIFLAAMPMIAGFANYILPLQIGAKDLAFPRINALGFWLLAAAAPMLYTGIFTGASADITWVMYPPYSSLMEASGPNAGTTGFLAGMILLGASSTLAGVNFIATVFTMRAPGVTWMRMPLFSWSVLVSVFMLYISLPALVIGLLLLYFDHSLATSFFITAEGGDPLLFQHLFWYFGHPEVYVVILPAFGMISEILATSARRSIFGYTSMVYAMAGIGVVGFVVWGHHMLTSGMDPMWRFIFMIMTMLVAIPTGVKIFNWLATLWGGSLVFKTHTLWAIGFLITFTLGGISGMFFPVAGMDGHFHDTYFVVAHFHYVFIGGTVFGIFAGIYYWYPKAIGRKMDERLGLWHFLISFSSYNAAFWPMHKLGVEGMPRRTHTYMMETGFGEYNMAVTVFAFIFGLSQLILVWNLVASSRRGRVAGNDPWGGWSLEWSTSSPPPTPSFDEIPTQRDANETHGHGAEQISERKRRLWSGERKDVTEVAAEATA